MSKLVIFPLKKELQFFSESLSDLKSVPGFSHPVFFSQSLDCYLAVGGHGKVAFAITMTEMIIKKKFSKVLAMGACGSLRTEIPLGTVMMVEKIFEHDVKPCFTTRSEQPFLLTTFSIQHPLLLSGTLASGDEDIIEKHRALDLRNRYRADAVTWESAGGAKAASRWNAAYSELRVVTDHCCENTAVDFHKSLQSGMQNLFKLFCLLKESSEW